ncbi:hypothetical protein [Promicromonospora sp. NPDC057488]|uniref:hypothetical protein n=1 Tax=Promicromonospora sp. NPDC057488 TaxID=3346147 RepID=UPI003671D1CC
MNAISPGVIREVQPDLDDRGERLMWGTPAGASGRPAAIAAAAVYLVRVTSVLPSVPVAVTTGAFGTVAVRDTASSPRPRSCVISSTAVQACERRWPLARTGVSQLLEQHQCLVVQQPERDLLTHAVPLARKIQHTPSLGEISR